MNLTYLKARLANCPNELRNIASQGWGKLRGNAISAYWYNYNNAGDQLTPLLLRHYGYSPYCVQPHEATIASVGSLLEDLPTNFSGIILGSGFIKESSRMSFPNARILAVRGKLTKAHMGASCDGMVLGDPGLLVSQMLRERKTKRFSLGVVPHYVDRRNSKFVELFRKHSTNIKVIDILKSDPMRVVRQVDECEHILSSSLHGLIMADSLGIPSAWFYSPGIIGGRFKYDDYYSSLGLADQTMHLISGQEEITEMQGWTSLKPVDAILQAKTALDNLFSNLGHFVNLVPNPNARSEQFERQPRDNDRNSG
jgi:pyruvyltransferase